MLNFNTCILTPAAMLHMFHVAHKKLLCMCATDRACEYVCIKVQYAAMQMLSR